MTRESLPRFDLYGELGVSPLASVGAIEAAYRSLVKQHHPDVSGSDDSARVKRLNLAREWLTDPARRQRYDAVRARLGGDAGRVGRWPARSEPTDPPTQSFGPNAAEVRQFLSQLRALDAYRARQVWDGHAVAHARGYGRARRAAAAIGRAERQDAWLFAREAASVIARGKLGDTTLTEQVLDVAADLAGAIAIRDLLPRHDFRLLIAPWTWRGEPVSGRAPAAAAAAAAAGHQPTPSRVSQWRPEPATTAPRMPTVRPEPAPEPSRQVPPGMPAPITPPVASQASLAATPITGTSPSTPAVTSTSAAATPPEPAIASAAARLTPPVLPAESSPWPEPTVRASVADLGTSSLGTAAAPPGPAAAGLATPVPADLDARRRAEMRQWVPGTAALIALALIGGAVVSLARPLSELSVAGITDAPSAPGATAAVVLPPPATTEPMQTGAGMSSGGPTDPTSDPTDPGDTGGASGGGGGGGGGGVGPGPTPKPTIPPGPTPAPTPAPTTPPAPTPTPTPAPTPTPGPTCIVINLINHQSWVAQQQWTAAGFTGLVIFNPPVPPDYQIKWQSRAVGSTAPCTSSIGVRAVAP